jgi:hypothetical protein
MFPMMAFPNDLLQEVDSGRNCIKQQHGWKLEMNDLLDRANPRDSLPLDNTIGSGPSSIKVTYNIVKDFKRTESSVISSNEPVGKSLLKDSYREVKFMNWSAKR